MNLEKLIAHLSDERVKRAVKVEACIISTLRSYLEKEGFVEILPVIISEITDPLTAIRSSLEVEINKVRLQLTKSMIFQKQLALMTFDKIFIFSPNIRVEEHERENTGRHLLEFVQLDVEIKNAKREEVMTFIEEMFTHLLIKLKEVCYKDLEYFGRIDLEIKGPFPRITHEEAFLTYGEKYEEEISKRSETPVWIINFPEDCREFYYKSDPQTRLMRDFDLIYPQGYGEALSGGERESSHDSVKRKLYGKERKILEFYCRLLKAGVSQSCGFGIGIERLTRFICGLEHVKYARLFPKLPGLKEFTI